MYKKIMVPLDGSELAECVLPHVEAIAGGCQVPDIIFIRTVQPIKLSPSLGLVEYIPSGEALGQIDTANKASAEEYLEGLIGHLKFGQASLKAEIIVGEGVAESLADYAAKNEVDLIVVATHGRSGVSRWVWGGVADRILHSACTPILMVRALGCMPGIQKMEGKEMVYSKIVVPLDGSELAECVLPHVEAIATGCGVPEVTFVHVIQPPEMLLSYRYISEKERQQFKSEDTAEAQKSAEDYLDRIVKNTNYKGLNVQSEVIMGKPAESIADFATKKEAELIVIATHGRSGVSRWAYGSVADRILRSSCVPVLMVRAPGCVPGI